MIPIVATLLSQGLSMLGNAVLTKGKAEVEKRIGVDLDTTVQSEDGLYRLRQMEADHEEFLLNASLEGAKLELENTKSARDMNTRINEAPNASWLAKNIAAILAILTVIGGGCMLAFSPESDVRTAAVGLVTLVLGFYFGSSSGSKDKSAIIKGMTS